MATILLIEDNDAIRSLFAMVLSEQYIVLEASNGAEGLRLFEMHQVDLIITDLSMPGLSGFELIRTIRASGSQVKIIACSALFNQGKDLEMAYNAGADRCLTKPVELDMLERAVAELLTT